MPFSDYPVLSSSRVATPKRRYDSSHRLACPSRASIGNSPVSIPLYGEPHFGLSTTLLSILRSSALTTVSALHDGACHVPPKLTHSVSTLSANRPEGHLHNLSSLFHPDNTHELLPARLDHTEIRVCLQTPASHAVYAFERTRKPATPEVYTLCKAAPSHACCQSKENTNPPGAFPFEALPSTTVESDFSGSSSYALHKIT